VKYPNLFAAFPYFFLNFIFFFCWGHFPVAHRKFPKNNHFLLSIRKQTEKMICRVKIPAWAASIWVRFSFAGEVGAARRSGLPAPPPTPNLRCALLGPPATTRSQCQGRGKLYPLYSTARVAVPKGLAPAKEVNPTLRRWGRLRDDLSLKVTANANEIFKVALFYLLCCSLMFPCGSAACR